ncbi:hypothetical protein AUJ84_00515 [Candidatus Pacearchaeota archaeon CG1_02_32_132]|nr:MAG: hypothetical protein AUJ84_00515 [Candidatus Pacearchaeota archaeon CG1_02_32_132]
MHLGNKKRGLSPVVATVLLITIVIVIALIIFLWAKGFVSERVQKFGQAVEYSCGNHEKSVDFVADYVATGNKIGLVNRGNVPLYGVVVKEIRPGAASKVNTKEPFGRTLSVGESREIELEDLDSRSKNLLIVPIILGQSGAERVAYTCDDAFGFPIEIN